MLQNLTDTLTEDDIRTFFKDSVQEEGVDIDVVKTKQHTTPYGHEKIGFYAGKRINGEMKDVTAYVAFDPHNGDDMDYLCQQISHVAREVATEFEEEMFDTIETCGTRLRFCVTNGGWVECERCNERVSLEGVTRTMTTLDSTPEFSNPTPSHYDVQNLLQDLDDSGREVLKLYLLGALREHCRCEFGKQSEYVHEPKDLSG